MEEKETKIFCKKFRWFLRLLFMSDESSFSIIFKNML